MKLRSLIVATVLLLALIGTLYWSEHKKPSEEASTASANSPTILKLDEAGVTKIEWKKKDAAPLVLTRTDSTWKITEPQPFAADQNTVSGVLSSLSNLGSERVVEDKASDVKQYGLDPPAIEVDVTGKDSKTQKLSLGDSTPTGSAVYTMLAGDPRVFTIPSYTKSSIDKNLNDLRDKRLLTVNSDKVSRLELIRKHQTIEFGRDKDEWQILKPKPMRADNFEVGELARKLTDARMDLSADSKAAASSFAHGTPVATAKLTDQSGTQELELRKNKDTYYATSSVVAGAYKVDSDLGQALEKNVDDFRNKKIFDFGFNDPDKVEMHSDSNGCFLTKGGNDWWSNGKKMDAAGVEDLVSQLRDLSASKFVESGFSSPSIEITVVSDSGKRVEKVAIAKAGDGYIAKRDDDSSLYQLSASSVDELKKSASELKPAATKK
jgi:hypothetical protein